jgi:hypothetical protein
MGIEILGSDHMKGQTISIMANADGDGAQTIDSNNIKLFSAPAAAEDSKPAFTGVPNGSLRVDDGGQETALDSGVPKDVKDEWPAPKEIRPFYFVKFRSYEDLQLKLKTDQADKDLQKKIQARYHITEALRTKRSGRAEVIEKLKPLSSEEKTYRKRLEEKKKEMEPLQAVLGKFKSANIASREKGQGLCSSVEELNRKIQSLQFTIEHDNNTLVEEKQMIREMKQLENTREKVIAHEAIQTKIQDSLGEKEVLQDHVKLLGVDLDAARKEQQAVWTKIKYLEEELRAIDEQINSLQDQLAVATQQRDKAFETLKQLRKERDAANLPYFQYRSVLNIAKEMATKKDKEALEEFSQKEVEKFMSQWKCSKIFREEYEKKNLSSLLSRQLSKDGRMRNPDEKPPVPEEGADVDSRIGRDILKKETMHSKTPRNVPGVPERNSSDLQAASNENHRQAAGPVKVKNPPQPTNIRESEIVSATDVGPGNNSATNNEAEAMHLKDKKREEEIVKAKLAQERKKRQAEKAQAKAVAKAQKEAEKKIKERERKARKKAATALVSGPEAEANAEVETASGANEQEPTINEDTVQLKDYETNEKQRQRKTDFAIKKGKPVFPKSAFKKKQYFSSLAWAGMIVPLLFVLFAIGYYRVFFITA